MACVQTLPVGGLFSKFQLDNNDDYVVDNAGVSWMAAVQMAINKVNDKSDDVYHDLLPNTQVCCRFRGMWFKIFCIILNQPYCWRCISAKLQLLVTDSKRQASRALEQVYTLAESECVAYIGPAASSPTKAVSLFTAIPRIDRAVIGYSATSTELSEPRFANFLRTPPADDGPANMMASLMGNL